MFKSILNTVVEAIKEAATFVKNVVMFKFFKNSTKNEGGELLTEETKFSWKKWFAGEYRLADVHMLEFFQILSGIKMLVVMVGIQILYALFVTPIIASNVLAFFFFLPFPIFMGLVSMAMDTKFIYMYGVKRNRRNGFAVE